MFGFKDARSLNYSPHQNSAGPTQDMDWIFDGAEYDPTWPNDYEKVVKGTVSNKAIKLNSSDFCCESYMWNNRKNSKNNNIKTYLLS